DSALDRADLQLRPGRDCQRRRAARNLCRVSTLRWFPGSDHGCAARPGRHPYPHAGAPGGILGHRPAGRLRAVLPLRLGGRRHLGGLEPGADTDWCYAAVGLARASAKLEDRGVLTSPSRGNPLGDTARRRCTDYGFPYPVIMNVTLTLDDALVKKVRKIAV